MPTPFEGEYGRIMLDKLGKSVGKRVEVTLRDVG